MPEDTMAGFLDHLCRTDGVIAVAVEGTIVERFPSVELQRVLLFGNVQVTTQAAAALLLQHAVHVAFFSGSGRYRGPQSSLRCSRESWAIRRCSTRSRGRDRSLTSRSPCTIPSQMNSENRLLVEQSRSLGEIRNEPWVRRDKPAERKG
ncbi:MAG TPA: CRISPR-associated endonuclease Cas1 [Kofleriaceae bacterium]|jgi:hypothetical protein|nr:CRISPR-associated endonuclease Cas1 [Kofleriaceae bacterium]